MQWWAVWVLAGLVLMGIELLTPGGFFFCFFGLAAMVTGGLIAGGFLESAALQWIVFSVASVVFILLFRNPLLRLMPPKDGKDDQDTVVGKEAVVLDAMAAGATGKVELRGSVWSARNMGTAALAPHATCKVVRVEGLTLDVQ